jgi:hypothetical protein
MFTSERNKLQELIILGSPRVGFHPVIPYHRQIIDPIIKEHAQYLSYDKALVNGLILCKLCHQIVTHKRSNKALILKHLQEVHHLKGRERPVPKIKPPEVTKEIATPNQIKAAQSEKEKEESNPLPYEVVVIDDEDSLPLVSFKPVPNPVLKKKRGRKQKDRTNGQLPRPNTKPDKKKLCSDDHHESKKDECGLDECS